LVAVNAVQAEDWNGASGREFIEQRERHERMLGRLTARLLAGARIQDGQNVLDVGCGCGDATTRRPRPRRPGPNPRGLREGGCAGELAADGEPPSRPLRASARSAARYSPSKSALRYPPWLAGQYLAAN
jgi:hypothetical protein